MSKYTAEFKLEVVKYYQEKRSSYQETANHFNIPANSIIKKWVRKYEANGKNGLMKNKEKYDGQFKMNVIKYMQENHLSYQETAIRYNLAGAEIIIGWERIYKEEGAAVLCEERRGRKSEMSKPKKKKLAKETEEGLIAEVQRLRMENAYLKKLNALVQERVKSAKKTKCEPSTN